VDASKEITKWGTWDAANLPIDHSPSAAEALVAFLDALLRRDRSELERALAQKEAPSLKPTANSLTLF
jgi:hypothetical protein